MRRGGLFVVAALVAACSSSSGGSSSSDDSSTPLDSSTDETIVDSSTNETSSETAGDATSDSSSDGDTGGACNALPVPTSVAETNVASDPPTMTGGTIPDGTWQLTSSEKFTGTGGASGPDGISLGQTLVFSTGTSVQSVASLAGTTARWSALYSAGGSDLALKPTCGAVTTPGTTAIFKYTASSTELQIQLDGTNTVETFTLK